MTVQRGTNSPHLTGSILDFREIRFSSVTCMLGMGGDMSREEKRYYMIRVMITCY